MDGLEQVVGSQLTAEEVERRRGVEAHPMVRRNLMMARGAVSE